MKKVLALILIICSLFIFVSCSSNSSLPKGDAYEICVANPSSDSKILYYNASEFKELKYEYVSDSLVKITMIQPTKEYKYHGNTANDSFMSDTRTYYYKADDIKYIIPMPKK